MHRFASVQPTLTTGVLGVQLNPLKVLLSGGTSTVEVVVDAMFAGESCFMSTIGTHVIV